MEKYKSFLDRHFVTLGLLFALLLTLAVLIGMIYLHSRPFDIAELEEHNAKLELIKEDFSNVMSLKNTTVNIYEDEIKVTFAGDDVLFTSFFDSNGNYLNHEIEDNRLTPDIFSWIFGLLFAFIVGVGVACLIEQILRLPIYISLLIAKKQSKRYNNL